MTVRRFATLPDAVALVHDALATYGGAERVLATVAELLPTAPIHTLVFDPQAVHGTSLEGREIHTSFVDRLPCARHHYRLMLPFLPLAAEGFDLTPFDVVLSFHYAVAHGVLTRPDQFHLSYTYTPLRHAWQQQRDFLRSLPPPARPLARPVLHHFRLWDRAAADGVDRFVAISRWIAACIWRAYRRRAPVVYPPVDVDAFEPGGTRGDHYLTLARLERHKRVDVVVEAFAHLDRPLLVVGDGPQRRALARRATPNVQFLGRVTHRELIDIMGRARGLVHAAEEDFGIALVEAQAAGCPVVAYAGGAAPELVKEGHTGVLFRSQTPEAVREAIETLEGLPRLRDADLRKHAERFSTERFEAEFQRVVEQAWDRFRTRRPGEDRRPGRTQPAASLVDA